MIAQPPGMASRIQLYSTLQLLRSGLSCIPECCSWTINLEHTSVPVSLHWNRDWSPPCQGDPTTSAILLQEILLESMPLGSERVCVYVVVEGRGQARENWRREADARWTRGQKQATIVDGPSNTRNSHCILSITNPELQISSSHPSYASQRHGARERRVEPNSSPRHGRPCRLHYNSWHPRI